MGEAGVVGILAGLTIAGGFVLTVLGGVLWLIDRRFEDEPELMAGRKLLKVGLAVMLTGAVLLTAVLLAT
ncbi:MAG TPA: hypothetical protein VHN37_09930 [Actinomycetota bacterium]|nr:hypothetical protein [Actinomycetota bacterium]